MRPTPAWFSELLALATKCARRDRPDHPPGAQPVWPSVVMGYDVEPYGGTVEFWGGRVYPASIDDNVIYHLDRFLKVLAPEPAITSGWNVVDVKGAFDGHEFRIAFHTHLPGPPRLKGATVERVFEGKPYVEPPIAPMGPDFGD